MSLDPRDEVLRVGPLEVHVRQPLARVEGRAAVVGGQAHKVLIALARRPTDIITRDELYREAWGGERQPLDRSVDVCVHKLRKALEQAGPRWRFIHGHKGHGYRLSPEPTRRPRAEGGQLGDGPAHIDPMQLCVTIDSKSVGLTAKEMDVLVFLAERAGQVVSREATFEALWNGPLTHRDRSVDVRVGHIRSKLACIAPTWIFIHTHQRGGYRFEPTLRKPKTRRNPAKTQ
jgi:DNA-binding response OmpR family regulator